MIEFICVNVVNIRKMANLLSWK